MRHNTLPPGEKTTNIIFWGVCLILFLPILVLPPSFQPSDWSRTTLFRTMLAVLVFLFLFRFFYKNEAPLSLPRWRLHDYLPIIVLSLFILTVLAATIFSQDPRFSFFSGPARAGGSLNLLFYFIFSIILAFFIKNKNWEKLWKINLVVASLASLLAIVQSFNLLKNVFVSYEGGGTPSFLGNSTFLAIYMFFMVIWSLVMVIQKKTRNQRLTYGILFCLFTLTVFLTGSRATYLALLVSFSFFFFFYPFKIKRIKTLKIAAGFLLVFATIIVLIFNFFPQLGEKNDLFSRLTNRLSLKRAFTDLAGTRFAVWQITLKAVKDKPLLGWGPENFYIGFEKYYEPTAPSLQKLWWDRPHNIFLDVAVNSGLIALFFYISFWLILLFYLHKFKYAERSISQEPNQSFRTNNALMAHGLQAAFIGYLTTLFFNFDSFSTYLISYFFIGFSFYLLFSVKESVEMKNNQKIVNYKNRKVFAGVFIVMLVLFVFFWNLKPFYINGTVTRAKNLSDIKSCDKALSTMEWANKNPGIVLVYNALTYSDIIKNCSTPEQEKELVEKGLTALKRASIIQPTWTRTWLFMGGLTNVLAAKETDINKRDELLKEAMGYLEKAQKLSPKRQEVLVEMEKNYLISANYQKMEKVANDCITIDPSQGICYWYLGIPEIFLGDQENGKNHIQEALDRGGFSPQYIQLGAAYLSQNNYKDAVNVYNILTASYPENIGYHAVMALLSKNVGDYDRAEIEALKVFQLDPKNEEALAFLQDLLSLNYNDPELHVSLAYIYKENGEKENEVQELMTAKNLYLGLISRQPGLAEYRLGISRIYKELQDYENAYQQALTALQLKPAWLEKINDYMGTFPDQFYERYKVDRAKYIQ